ncbi:MAG TPA: hypothetical protein VN806_12960 [Caulobacteraceae bacterium]|jgi:hypothetical protein|nr:hypothetical protein [Caulobacteraceae bacterium]
MIQASNLPAIQAWALSSPAGRPRPDPTANDAGKDRGDPWARLRPFAYLAPLAVNWPGGRMAL